MRCRSYIIPGKKYHFYRFYGKCVFSGTSRHLSPCLLRSCRSESAAHFRPDRCCSHRCAVFTEPFPSEMPPRKRPGRNVPEHSGENRRSAFHPFLRNSYRSRTTPCSRGSTASSRRHCPSAGWVVFPPTYSKMEGTPESPSIPG